MAAVDISIIIPTYNRAQALSKCLSALDQQKVSGYCEVLVIDDGSSDNTKELVRSLRTLYQWSLSYYWQPNKGPAAARNVGLKNAQGQIVVIIGDDIIPAADTFLEEHLRWHRDLHPFSNVGVLGYTTWSPELYITPYMRWLESSGLQFDYCSLKHCDFIDYWHFYTSNISLKKSFLHDDTFDERFPFAAYEDVEFGYRLCQRGLKVIYNQEARAYHYHQVDLEGYCKRAYLAGKSKALFDRVVPTCSSETFHLRLLRLGKKVIFNALFNALTISFWLPMAKFFEKRFVVKLLFLGVYEYYFFKGFEEVTDQTQT
jgi:glycosyltransferase involved in cell wall biosynthesis